MTVSENIRRELVRLCSSDRTRRAEFSRSLPTHWSPTEGYDSATKEPFTRGGAWEAVCRQLAAGCALNAIELDIPKGKTGYWFHFHDARGTRIYVKLQIGSGVVFGRSFHEG